jgi:dTDP-4-amino-4,6-dideoxy-D-glucose acyltransferase
MGFCSREELASLGLKSFGSNVLVSRKASLYNAGGIELGDHVRIDDFCVLSAGAGGIAIGSFIHVAVYTCLIGAGRITLHDYSAISSRVSIYSSNDDYSGEHLISPMVPDEFTGVTSLPVTIGRHVIVGSGSVILPGVTIGEGAAIGALSVVRKDCEGFMIYGGNPLQPLRCRSRRLLELEALHREAAVTTSVRGPKGTG